MKASAKVGTARNKPLMRNAGRPTTVAKTAAKTVAAGTATQNGSPTLPVSDAANARLQPPTEHFRELLGAAARDQAIAGGWSAAAVSAGRWIDWSGT